MSGSTTHAALPAALRQTLDAVLDSLIPPSGDGRLPGAGALGLGEAVALRFGDGLAALGPGFDALDARSGERGAARFVDLAPEQRIEVLAAHAVDDPGFLPGLIFHTYALYYMEPAVQNALGLEGRPPHPKGYTIGPDDPRLLDPVRARASLYRRV